MSVVLLCKGAVPRAPRRFAWESASWSWSQWTNTGLAASLMNEDRSAPVPCAGSFPAPPPRSAYPRFLTRKRNDASSSVEVPRCSIGELSGWPSSPLAAHLGWRRRGRCRWRKCCWCCSGRRFASFSSSSLWAAEPDSIGGKWIEEETAQSVRFFGLPSSHPTCWYPHAWRECWAMRFLAA